MLQVNKLTAASFSLCPLLNTQESGESYEILVDFAVVSRHVSTYFDQIYTQIYTKYPLFSSPLADNVDHLRRSCYPVYSVVTKIALRSIMVLESYNVSDVQN